MWSFPPHEPTAPMLQGWHTRLAVWRALSEPQHGPDMAAVVRVAACIRAVPELASAICQRQSAGRCQGRGVRTGVPGPGEGVGGHFKGTRSVHSRVGEWPIWRKSQEQDFPSAEQLSAAPPWSISRSLQACPLLDM